MFVQAYAAFICFPQLLSLRSGLIGKSFSLSLPSFLPPSLSPSFSLSLSISLSLSHTHTYTHICAHNCKSSIVEYFVLASVLKKKKKKNPSCSIIAQNIGNSKTNVAIYNYFHGKKTPSTLSITSLEGSVQRINLCI